MKRLWIIGAGEEAVEGIRHAKGLGHYIIASDANPRAPGFKFADESFTISIYDVETHRRTLSEIPIIDGVLCMCCDAPRTQARMAQVAGLPGISPWAAYLSVNKIDQKIKLQEAGIPVPEFRVINMPSDLSLLRLPVVIKPVDSRGSRGVSLVRDKADLIKAYHWAKSFNNTGREVLAEEFLQGPQVSTESVITPDWAVTPGFSDRNYDFAATAPYIVENGGTQPSVLSRKDQDALCELAEEAARVLGFVNWTAKGDLVLTEDGPKVIEMAGRLSGGHFATSQIPQSTGVDLVGIAVKLALGEPVTKQEATPKYHKHVAIRYQMPEGISNHTQRGPYCIGVGETREEAVRRASASA